MSIETTAPAPAIAGHANPISDQAPAVAALLALTDMFGTLPSGYITIHTTGDVRVGLQLETPAEFEAWRTALLVPPEDVELKQWNGSTWLSVDGLFRGVGIHLTGYGIAVPASAAEAVAA
ncbi:hypothetical protein ACGFY0_45255 [Streptomyces chartreusis]|uniref:hypothetical protein n=1 Tax=Streptomyces chartreusis TaxID=1969 RepID=UPI00372356D2